MIKIGQLDPFLLIPSISISIISIFLQLASSASLFIPQLIFTLTGLLIFLIFFSIDFQIWPKYRNVFYILSLILLSVIFLLPKVRGAHRWIDFGFFVLQPSEILKPIIIILYSSTLSKIKNINFSKFILLIFSFLPILLLIYFQPDLGNAIIFLSLFTGLLIIGGVKFSYLLTSFFAFFLIIPLFWNFLKDYQKLRIISFLNPNLDPSGAGYNAIQSIIAIGSGGLFGLGLGRGSQSRLQFLPEFQTDFIFASLVESLGLFGGVVLLLLYLVILIRILTLAFSSENKLAQYILIGIFCQNFVQVLINIGMNLGIMPITGITLPLLSYGGSSIVSTFACLGLVNSISRSMPKKLLVIR